MQVDAMVLAAGKSTRIASIGEGLPKPLLRIDGEPILLRNIRWLASAGIRDVWVNLHYRGDLVRAALGDGRSWNVRVHYSEEPSILGTAGAVRKILQHLSSSFLVVYGDNLVDFDLRSFVAFHRDRQAQITIAVFDDKTPNTGIAGGRVALDGDNNVVAFVEGSHTASGSPFVNAGVYAIERNVLASFPENCFLDWGRDVFPALLERRSRLLGYRIEGYCLGFDTPESFRRGLSLIESGEVSLR